MTGFGQKFVHTESLWWLGAVVSLPDDIADGIWPLRIHCAEAAFYISFDFSNALLWRAMYYGVLFPYGSEG